MEKKLTIQLASKKMITIFLAVMLIFTILSRSLDSIRIPKVNTGHLQKGNLNYEVSGQGKIEAGEVISVPILAGMKIRKIDAFEGKGIVSGETLFVFQMEELQEAYTAKERDLKQLELSLEAEKLGSYPLPQMSAEELAAQTLNKAEEVLTKTQDKYGKIEEEHFNKLARIQEDYEADKAKTKEQLLQERYDTYMGASRAYETALINEEEAVKAAKWALVDAERARDEGSGDEDALQSGVRRAEQLVELTEEKWNIAVTEANEDRLNKKKIYEDMKNGVDDGMKSLKTEYEAAIERAEKELEAEAENLNSALDSYKDAAEKLQNAKVNDSYSAVAAQRKIDLSVLQQKSISLSIEQKQSEIDKLSALIDANGEVKSSHDGVITKLTVEPGQTTTGSDELHIGFGEIKLKGTISKEEAKYVASGDELSLSKDGMPLSNTTGMVESVILSEDGEQAVITSRLTGSNLTIGSAINFKTNSQSSVYDKIISIDAVRKDNAGNYLLVVQDRKTILGTEQVAVRIEVTLLENNTSKAAIQGSLSYDDIIITGSNKSIQEGDRVRVMSK